MSRQVVFAKVFQEQIQENYDFIKQDSPDSAKRFKEGIPSAITKIKKHPFASPTIDLDGFDNPNNEYRFFQYFNVFKIIFKVTTDLLTFLGMIHERRDVAALKELESEKEEA